MASGEESVGSLQQQEGGATGRHGRRHGGTVPGRGVADDDPGGATAVIEAVSTLNMPRCGDRLRERRWGWVRQLGCGRHGRDKPSNKPWLGHT